MTAIRFKHLPCDTVFIVPLSGVVEANNIRCPNSTCNALLRGDVIEALGLIATGFRKLDVLLHGSNEEWDIALVDLS